MFKKNLKRFVAILMTAAMVIGSSAMAYADPQYNEAGDIEGWVNKKIFTILVPTASANALKMLVDPQKLIRETDAAAKEGLSANDFDDATVLFPRTETGTGIKKFSSESDTISMANVGTVSVNYTIQVGVTDLGDIVLSDNKTTINNTTDKAVLFVEMLKGQLPGNNSSGVDWAQANLTKWRAVGAGGTGATDAIVVSQNKSVTLSADVVPTVKTLYKVSWNSADKYTFGIPKTSVSTAKINAYGNNDGLFKTQFSGTTNNGDLVVWKNAKAAQPKLTLTYSFEAIEEGADEKDLPSEEDVKVGYGAIIGSNFYLGSSESGFEASPSFTGLKVNGVDVQAIGQVINDGGYFIKLSAAACMSAGLQEADEYVFTFKVGDDSYKCVVADE